MTLTGTPSQVELAEAIRVTVAEEFDRVAKAFHAVAQRQAPVKAAETRVVIEILERKRAETMARTEAGYFIRYWQELNDQVRRLIFEDPRYQKIRNPGAAQAALPDSVRIGELETAGSVIATDQR